MSVRREALWTWSVSVIQMYCTFLINQTTFYHWLRVNNVLQTHTITMVELPCTGLTHQRICILHHSTSVSAASGRPALPLYVSVCNVSPCCTKGTFLTVWCCTVDGPKQCFFSLLLFFKDVVMICSVICESILSCRSLWMSVVQV